MKIPKINVPVVTAAVLLIATIVYSKSCRAKNEREERDLVRSQIAISPPPQASASTTTTVIHRDWMTGDAVQTETNIGPTPAANTPIPDVSTVGSAEPRFFKGKLGVDYIGYRKDCTMAAMPATDPMRYWYSVNEDQLVKEGKFLLTSWIPLTGTINFTVRWAGSPVIILDRYKKPQKIVKINHEKPEEAFTLQPNGSWGPSEAFNLWDQGVLTSVRFGKEAVEGPTLTPDPVTGIIPPSASEFMAVDFGIGAEPKKGLF